jgi:hypothetical protein
MTPEQLEVGDVIIYKLALGRTLGDGTHPAHPRVYTGLVTQVTDSEVFLTRRESSLRSEGTRHIHDAWVSKARMQRLQLVGRSKDALPRTILDEIDDA